MEKIDSNRAHVEPTAYGVKNGKFFVEPTSTDEDFKYLFRRLTGLGAGRPVDDNGLPDGPWTAEQLVEVITLIAPTEDNIELRTVQLWFQPNESGISSKNIRWLARIFGCGDAEATARWQAELTNSRNRFTARRRMFKSVPQKEVSRLAPIDVARSRRSLPTIAVSMFANSQLNLASVVFGGMVALGFSSYFLGINSFLSDARTEGQVFKQVGFTWSINWTLSFLFCVPIFLFNVSSLLIRWLRDVRPVLAKIATNGANISTWSVRINSHSMSFWTVLFTIFFFAGAVQWLSLRVKPLYEHTSDFAEDWGTLSIAHPEVISHTESIIFTAVAYLYMSFSFTVFFFGLILLHSITLDLSGISEAFVRQQDQENEDSIDNASTDVSNTVFRCTILGILVAIFMNMQTFYLISDAPNMVLWLSNDMMLLLGAPLSPSVMNNYRTPNQFSSLMIVLPCLFVFLHTELQLQRHRPFGSLCRIVLVLLLFVSYLTIGHVIGFSLFLLVSICASAIAYIVAKPHLNRELSTDLRNGA